MRPEAAAEPERDVLTFTGTVRNCGNAPLDGVMVTSQVNGGTVQVLGPITLAIGQSAPFSGSWVPANPCAPSTAVFVATGTDNLTTPRTVTANTWATDYVTVDDVSKEGGKCEVRASFVVEAGTPGIKKA